MPDDDDDEIIIIRRNQVSTRGLTLEEIGRLRQIEAKGDAPLSLVDRASLASILFRQSGRP